MHDLELLSVKQAAEWLGFPVWKVREMAAAKLIPHVQPAGKRGKLYFRRSALEAWVERHEARSADDADAEWGEVAS